MIAFPQCIERQEELFLKQNSVILMEDAESLRLSEALQLNTLKRGFQAHADHFEAFAELCHFKTKEILPK